MATFDCSAVASAAPDEVWMLLYDPSRFLQWWTGVAASAQSLDFPMPQSLQTSARDGRVTISCSVSDLVFQWLLTPVDGGTEISVHVEVPETEAARLDMQRDIIASALQRLATLSSAGADVLD